MRGKRTIGIVAATVAASFWFSPVAAAVDVTPVLERMERGDIRAAREQLNELEARHSDHPQVRFLDARLLAKEGDVEGGIERLEALIEEFPDRPGPYNNLARLYAREGQMEKARDTLEAGLATNETYAKLYQNLSTIYVEMARQSYAKALQLDGERGNRTKLAEVTRLASDAEVERRLSLATRGDGNATDSAERAEEKPPESGGFGGMSEQERAAVETLRRWARAWSAQDVDSYLGYYASDYSPSGMGRGAWIDLRERRLQAPEWIEVTLTAGRAYQMLPGEIVVVAEQDYTADSYSSLTLKSFTLVRGSDGWRITAENTIRDIVR